MLPLKTQHEVQWAWRQEADVGLRKEEQSTMLAEFRQQEADAVFSDGSKPGGLSADGQTKDKQREESFLRSIACGDKWKIHRAGQESQVPPFQQVWVM